MNQIYHSETELIWSKRALFQRDGPYILATPTGLLSSASLLLPRAIRGRAITTHHPSCFDGLTPMASVIMAFETESAKGSRPSEARVSGALRRGASIASRATRCCRSSTRATIRPARSPRRRSSTRSRSTRTSPVRPCPQGNKTGRLKVPQQAHSGGRRFAHPSGSEWLGRSTPALSCVVKSDPQASRVWKVDDATPPHI
jgi:hypothetical protein